MWVGYYWYGLIRVISYYLNSSAQQHKHLVVDAAPLKVKLLFQVVFCVVLYTFYGMRCRCWKPSYVKNAVLVVLCVRIPYTLSRDDHSSAEMHHRKQSPKWIEVPGASCTCSAVQIELMKINWLTFIECLIIRRGEEGEDADPEGVELRRRRGGAFKEDQGLSLHACWVNNPTQHIVNVWNFRKLDL